jgi:hypothetical protein
MVKASCQTDSPTYQKGYQQALEDFAIAKRCCDSECSSVSENRASCHIRNLVGLTHRIISRQLTMQVQSASEVIRLPTPQN